MDITSANSSVTLITALTPAGLKFEKYSADSAWSQDNYENVEHRMGVDGKMAVGFTPVEKSITFTFEADSPTLDGLDLIWQTTEATKAPIVANMVMTIPSIKKTISLSNGVLVGYKLIPNSDRVLAPKEATFVFESVNSVPLA